MPVHMTSGRQLPGFGSEPLVGFGLLSPAAASLGLAAMSRSNQPDRLFVDNSPPATAEPSRQFLYRLMDPRTMDATHMLDAGAPSVQQMFQPAQFPWRRTEAPKQFQRQIPLGGRQVLILPPGA